MLPPEFITYAKNELHRILPKYAIESDSGVIRMHKNNCGFYFEERIRDHAELEKNWLEKISDAASINIPSEILDAAKKGTDPEDLALKYFLWNVTKERFTERIQSRNRTKQTLFGGPNS